MLLLCRYFFSGYAAHRWAQHSIMSRKLFKQAIGTWEKPIDRPLFGLFSCFALSFWTLLWRPISDCARTDFTDLSAFNPTVLVVNGVLVFVLVAFILSYFWILPDHVFGTSNYKILKNPPKPQIITGFPYGIVRHPVRIAVLSCCMKAAFIFAFVNSLTAIHMHVSLCQPRVATGRRRFPVAVLGVAVVHDHSHFLCHPVVDLYHCRYAL